MYCSQVKCSTCKLSIVQNLLKPKYTKNNITCKFLNRKFLAEHHTLVKKKCRLPFVSFLQMLVDWQIQVRITRGSLFYAEFLVWGSYLVSFPDDKKAVYRFVYTPAQEFAQKNHSFLKSLCNDLFVLFLRYSHARPALVGKLECSCRRIDECYRWTCSIRTRHRSNAQVSTRIVDHSRCSLLSMCSGQTSRTLAAVALSFWQHNNGVQARNVSVTQIALIKHLKKTTRGGVGGGRTCPFYHLVCSKNKF